MYFYLHFYNPVDCLIQSTLCPVDSGFTLCLCMWMTFICMYIIAHVMEKVQQQLSKTAFNSPSDSGFISTVICWTAEKCDARVCTTKQCFDCVVTEV
jgi:hypothetical protein